MSGDSPKKIIVDDDWKTKVQAEKEALRQPVEDWETPTAPQREPDASAAFPPPSFALLISTLATEALAALGQFSRPDDKSSPIMLEQAKHFIDLLAILEEKTKGNLTSEETAMLENVLHELRMVYIRSK